MSKKKILDNLDKITEGARLTEKTNSLEEKKAKPKAKLIHIDPLWEKKIKEYSGGAITAYIRLAIREKMQRDNIF